MLGEKNYIRVNNNKLSQKAELFVSPQHMSINIDVNTHAYAHVCV